jgi:hypothetical protein
MLGASKNCLNIQTEALPKKPPGKLHVGGTDFVKAVLEGTTLYI